MNDHDVNRMTDREILFSVSQKLDNLTGMIWKLIFSLIGIIGGEIGLKLVHTTLVDIISSYLLGFGSFSLFALLLFRWKHIPKRHKGLCIAIIITGLNRLVLIYVANIYATILIQSSLIFAIVTTFVVIIIIKEPSIWK